MADPRTDQDEQHRASRGIVASRVLANWKPVTVVLLGGLLAGMAFAALQSKRTIESHPAHAPAVVASVSGTERSGSASDEVAKLEIRNRRLEALVMVLRERRHNQAVVR